MRSAVLKMNTLRSWVAVDKIPGINKVTKEVVKTATEATAKKVIKKE